MHPIPRATVRRPELLMFNSAILDVAIGIAFVYLFLSLVCSVVNEGIAALFSLRSKNLVAGINSLFSESTLKDGKPFVQAIYEHGLIRGLFQDPPSPQASNSAAKPASKDSLADKITRLLQNQANPKDLLTRIPVPVTSLDFVLNTAKKPFHVNLPSYIPSRAFSSALVGVLLPSTNGEPQGLAELREKIAELPESPTREALLNLVASTGKDIQEFQQKAEKWFDDGMDRVAGWYKRRAQKFLIAIGFAVAIILNVDTINLAQRLWNNPAEREAMVDAAKNYADQNKTAIPEGELKQQARFVTDMEKQIPFPFGWHGVPQEASFSYWLFALVGWSITALALSLGAPFWFDTLNKFMVVRSTVKPREKSPPESSKD